MRQQSKLLKNDKEQNNNQLLIEYIERAKKLSMKKYKENEANDVEYRIMLKVLHCIYYSSYLSTYNTHFNYKNYIIKQKVINEIE